jgi:hypothetical protein
MLTYDTPALRQTGSRNLTGQQTLPTIWLYLHEACDQIHRCQPLRFFRIFYEFRAKVTVLRSTVYLLRISDYCQPGTVLHLNIIVII